MVWLAVGVAAVGAVGTIAAADMSANAAKSAAETQANAAATANAQQRADQAPWRDAGGAAITQLGKDISPGGQFTKPFTMADATNSSAEQHALQQGKIAIDNSAAARGGLLSTNDIQDNTKFAEGTAASFQNQAFNQWLQQNQQQLNAKQSVAGVGQSAAQNTADNSANILMAQGSAQAAGQIGAAGAYNKGLTSITNQMGTLAGLFGAKVPDAGGGATPAYDPIITANVGNDAVSAGSSFANADFSISDRRVKTDIKVVGRTAKGLPIYTYRMKGGGPVKMGLMAQDVEQVNPGAVREDSDGVKMVNYAEA